MYIRKNNWTASIREVFRAARWNRVRAKFIVIECKKRETEDCDRESAKDEMIRAAYNGNEIAHDRRESRGNDWRGVGGEGERCFPHPLIGKATALATKLQRRKKCITRAVSIFVRIKRIYVLSTNPLHFDKTNKSVLVNGGESSRPFPRKGNAIKSKIHFLKTPFV